MTLDVANNSRKSLHGKLAYLATPYSHLNPSVQEMRFARINKIAARLMASGCHLYSPISHTHPISVEGDLPGDFEYWKEFAKVMLSRCDQLIVVRMDGWLESVGVQAEIEIATEMEMPVLFIDP